MKIDIMTLFPEMCETVLNESIIGRARKTGKVELSCVNIRDFSANKHNRVDDAPFGGGMGMVFEATPVYDCFHSLWEPQEEKPHLIYCSPKGKPFTQQTAVRLSRMEHIVFLCGHYEGVDQRVLDELVDEELSLGDFVLTGGELPALCFTDAICRMLPGVLSNDTCFTEESHYAGLLEYPHYTRPAVWHERPVPEVLLSGDHVAVDAWRRKESLKITYDRRPDLLSHADLSEADLAFLRAYKQQRKAEKKSCPGGDSDGQKI